LKIILTASLSLKKRWQHGAKLPNLTSCSKTCLKPVNRYVADFVGKTNFVTGTVSQINGSSIGLKTSTGREFFGKRNTTASALEKGAQVSLAVRPELVVVGVEKSTAGDLKSDIALGGTIKNQIFLGEHTEYLVDVEEIGDVLVLSPKYIESSGGGFGLDEKVTVGWRNELALVLEDS